jgi:hypothetical protein
LGFGMSSPTEGDRHRDWLTLSITRLLFVHAFWARLSLSRGSDEHMVHIDI